MAPLSEQAEPGGRGEAHPTIALVGFMGAGKTRAGAAIASVLGEEWFDSDAEIERELGETIASYFEREGEASFREAEERVVLELLGRGGVVSLGGGAIESPTVRAPPEGVLYRAGAVSTPIPRGSGRAATAAGRWHRTGSASNSALRGREHLYAEVSPRRCSIPAASGPAGPPHAGFGPPPARMGRGLPGPHRAPAAIRRSSPPTRSVYSAREPARLLATGTPTSGQGAGSRSPIPPRSPRIPAALAAAEHVIEVAGGEASKTLSEAEQLLRELARLGARRDDGVIAFGGGVVGDLAGFCAATYQRGVPVMQVPTTLVAQVDSAYGGKTGVDLPEAKNYAGAYHMPSAVLTDPGLPADAAAGGACGGVRRGRQDRAARRRLAVGEGPLRSTGSMRARFPERGLRLCRDQDRRRRERRARRRRPPAAQPGPHGRARDRGGRRATGATATARPWRSACSRRCGSPAPTRCTRRSRSCSSARACRPGSTLR